MNSELALSFADTSLSSVSGRADIDNLSLVNSQQSELMSWQQLAIDDIAVSLAQQQVSVGKMTMSKPTAQLRIDASGVSNIQQLIKPSEEQQADVQVYQADNSSPWQVAVKEVVIDNGQLDFADQSLVTPFATQIADFEGTITRFDSSGNKAAKVNLKGLVDEYAPVSLSGTLGPATPTMALNLKCTFDRMELASLSPYSGTYVGRAIEQGQLSLTLDYQLEKNRLQGKNKVRIEHISLGEKVDSPNAASLPLGAAIALLKNPSGVIHLNVPVSGQVDDPSFTVAGVVWGAFGNLIVKTVASPFSLLGSLVGSSDDLQRIPFAPGTAQLNELAQTKLRDLATALQQRPELKLRLSGHYDSERDLQYMQQQQLAMRLQQHGIDPESLSDRGDSWSAEVMRLYRRQFADRAVAGRPASELYDELIAAEQVDSAALIALANSRADSVRQQLVTILSVAGPRVEIKEASDKSSDGSQVVLDI